MNTTRADVAEDRSGPGSGSREQALDVALRCFVDAVGADTGAILLRDQGIIRMVSYWVGEGQQLSIAWTSESLLGRSFEVDGALIEHGTAAEGDRAEPISAIASRFEHNDGDLGAIYAGFSEARRGGEPELVRATESYARLAGLCLAQSGSLASALTAPNLDALTGCMSYGGVSDAFRVEVERSRRHGHRLCCCFIDLDGFKLINDEHGHLHGNEVLSAAGSGLRKAARRYDLVGRFGGDEFIVVLPETPGRAARSIATRLRGSILEAIAEATRVPVGVSIGIAEWDGEATATELFDVADAALREAKSAGGGRIVGPGPDERGDRLVELTKSLVRPWRETRRPAGRDADDPPRASER